MKVGMVIKLFSKYYVSYSLLQRHNVKYVVYIVICVHKIFPLLPCERCTTTERAKTYNSKQLLWHQKIWNLFGSWRKYVKLHLLCNWLPFYFHGSLKTTICRGLTGINMKVENKSQSESFVYRRPLLSATQSGLIALDGFYD